MNKLLFVTLATFVACAVANPLVQPTNEEVQDDLSQLALFEADDVETGSMREDRKGLFQDFCLQSRDDVRAHLQNTVNEGVSKVFNVMFNTLTDINLEVIETQKGAVAQGEELIRASGIETLGGVAKNEDELQANINAKMAKLGDTIEDYEKRGLLARIGQSVAIVFRAVVETIAAETTKRLALLKAQFNGENVRAQIVEACNTINLQLKRQIEDDLKKQKLALSKAQGQSDEFMSVIQSTDLSNVGCVTTGRINKVARFCDYLTIVGPILYPLVGI